MNRKRFVALFLTLWLMVGYPSFVFAQEIATPSATPIVNQEASASAAFEATGSASFTEAVATPSADLSSEEASPSSFLWENADGLPLDKNRAMGESSAVLKQPIRVRSLSKRTFRADEKITVVLDNTLNANTTVTLFDSDGREVDATIELISDYDPTVFRITPPNHLRPGRYRIKITDPEGTVTTQDFTWGVLALNPDKATYLPNETSNIAIAVLDETGNMVCNADVSLRVRHILLGEDFPTGSEVELSTANGKITVNPECSVKDFVLKPDYETSYQVAGPGTYQLTLTAQTSEGSHTIEDAFEVRETIAFDIKRTSATRIFPPKTYPMMFDIIAAEDFEGTITEVVPGNFAVSSLEGARSFAQVDRVSAGTESALLKDAVVPTLSPPFDQAHPINLGFGEQLRDPLLTKKYSDFGLLGHDGIDFDLAEGTPVLSVDDGTVARVRQNGDYGQTVVIQHAWGKSYYGHLSLITAKEGDAIQKGHPLGLSGSTGLSTGPHLHFGIKPNDHDMENGYYGKINPLPYLAFKEGNQDVLGVETDVPAPVVVATDDSSSQVVRWNVSFKKGEKTTLGYSYQVPNISPQFYLLGPLTFEKEGETVFTENRRWQLAIDADGSGTNSVSPATAATSAQDQTYTFTFTAGETMDSGGIKITAPAGWNAPQGSSGTAGYTTVTGNSNATVATVFDAFDSATGWAEVGGTDACQTGPVADTTDKQEGTGSITCNDDTSGANGPDNGDGIVFSFTSQDWSAYTDFGFWMRAQNGNIAADFQYNINDGTDCTTTPIQTVTSSTLTANQWTFEKFTLSGTRTAVTRFCVRANTAASLDNNQIWVDEALLGPGTPTFSGQDVSFRVLDAANGETFSIVYGAGGGTSGVDNPAGAQVYTFTTQSRPLVTGTLTNLTAGSPTIELCAGGCGPTTDQQMRHGNWFSSGTEQSFTF